ncbi:MAG: NUDIX hydrolase [Bacteroidia bacterium]
MQVIVRAYGIIPNSAGEVLVMHEEFLGEKVWKFPGGGWEYGEGVVGTLRRELAEELEVQPRLYQLFYVPWHFQASYAHKAAQLLSVYYLVHLRQEPCKLPPQAHWRLVSEVSFALPLDRIVQRKLLRLFPDGKVK